MTNRTKTLHLVVMSLVDGPQFFPMIARSMRLHSRFFGVGVEVEAWVECDTKKFEKISA